MNRRSFIASLIVPLAAQALPQCGASTEFVGMDLAKGPDVTALCLYPWQQDLLEVIYSNTPTRISIVQRMARSRRYDRMIITSTTGL